MHAEALLAPAAVAAGWLGQACFFARFFVQWLASERARRCVVPGSFWWLSLAGALLMTGYALGRGTYVLLFGFGVTGALAVRNLWLARSSARPGPRGAGALAALAVVITLASLAFALAAESGVVRDPLAWTIVAVAGQALWTARFPVQWWLSERAGRSQFPPAFWWLSLGGNGLLLAYAVHLRDPVFVLGFLPGPLLQTRNLVLGRRASAATG